MQSRRTQPVASPESEGLDAPECVCALAGRWMLLRKRQRRPCICTVVGGCDAPRAAAQVVCELQGRGYNVTYDRFQGGHVLPPAAAAGMVDWFLGRGALASAASPLCPGST